MTKYIVKNCPAYGVTTPTSCALTSDDSCKFTDCPIKQVAELVETENKVHRKIQRPIPTLNEKILQTLQVEEVE